jgi:hypothetical protein
MMKYSSAGMGLRIVVMRGETVVVLRIFDIVDIVDSG